MTDEQLAVLLNNYKRKLKEVRDEIYNALPDQAIKERKNMLNEIVRIAPSLEPLDDMIDNLEEDIKILIGD